MLGGEADAEPLRLALNPPTVILMAGLQGSGKTTMSAKIALRLTRTERKRVMMASLDVRRPAAMEQLAILGKEAGVDTLPIVAGQAPADIARRAMSAAKLGGFDVLILDTAGRTTLDEAMMSEAADIARIAVPAETLLVADSLTGQDAVRTATAFHEGACRSPAWCSPAPMAIRAAARRFPCGRSPVCRSSSWARARRSMPSMSSTLAGSPAGFLGQGDVVALVEKAAAEFDQAKAEVMARKLAKGQFDLEDMADQLAQMERMGGMEGLLGLLPGVQKVKQQIAESGVSDKMIRRQRAIIGSMTRKERRKPDILQASRKRRIASGAGVEVAEINRLLKQHRQMQDAFKMMAKGGGKGFARMAGMMGLGGPGGLDSLKALGGGSPPPGAELPPPGLTGLGVAPPKTLPGLGGINPGFNPFKKP